MPAGRHGSGKLIRCSEGYEAFIPGPLPPKTAFSLNVLRSLSDADRLIGQLSGEGRKLPNPHLLTRPFMKREAVLSSRIEGTVATLGELLAADAGAVVERSPDDLREVGNYVSALDYGVDRLRSNPLSLRLIAELHERLMRGVRGDRAAPGEFRKSQNWIGPAGCTLENATFIPPPADHVMRCLRDLEEFLHDRSLPPLMQIAMAHYQFEAIHPFLDGNGRVGRLLITLFLVERQILPTPLLYLSAFFEATRSDYYGGLSAVTRASDWEGWLQYFFNGVARMSEDVISRAERINLCLAEWRLVVSGAGGKTPLDLVELLAENPYWTVGKVADRMGVAYTTAQRAIDRLVSLDVLSQIGESKRDRVYCASRIMEILDEPPTMRPGNP